MIVLFLASVIFPLIVGGRTPAVKPEVKTMVERKLPLDNRYKNTYVNDVFKDNILLTVYYATGDEIRPNKIDWNRIDRKFKRSMTLKPGEIFAFHDDVLPEYAGKVDKTSNAHFNAAEGFKSDGYLFGDGVCHLASILYWVAKSAGLKTLAPTRHDFAPIPDVPRQYGVSIYANSSAKSYSYELQNLYITNNKDNIVTFEFEYDNNILTVRAFETS